MMMSALQPWLLEAQKMGLSAETLVFLLMLPLVATLASVLHQIVGVKGFGTYMPTMLSVGLLATGVFGGMWLFVLVLGVSVLGSTIIRKLDLHYWPGRSMNLVFMSLAVFLGLTVVAKMGIELSEVSIFPILFMIVLSEEFLKTQLVKSKNQAKIMLFGTLLLSTVGAGIASASVVQNFVLRFPEVVILVVLIINFWVGRYSGIRITEINRFKKAIR